MIADIYVRVLRKPIPPKPKMRRQPKPAPVNPIIARQEAACRAWCQENGYDVRHVIIDAGRVFGDGKSAAPAFRRAWDSWRKKHWEDRGEPLDADECDPTVAPVPPPNALVMETIDRLYGCGPVEGAFMLRMMEGIGIKTVSLDVPTTANVEAVGPMVYHDKGVAVQINPDGSMMFRKSEA